MSEANTYWALHPDAHLRKESTCASVFRVDLQEARLLSPLQATVLAMCDGTKREDDIVRFVRDGFGIDETMANTFVRATLKAHAMFLSFASAKRECFRYDPLEFVFSIPETAVRRTDAPLFLTWLATKRCPFECTYCCIKTSSVWDHESPEISTASILSVFNEALSLGTKGFFLSGGEPFLRKDIADVVRFITHRGGLVQTSTKLQLNAQTLRGLAEAGLRELQVSIDDYVPEVLRQLVQDPQYFERVSSTITTALAVGLAVSTNTVVTSLNIRHIPQLVARLAHLGVKKIILSNYIRSMWKHVDALFPTAEDYAWLEDQFVSLMHQAGDTLELRQCRTKDPRTTLGSDGKCVACPGGIYGLVISSNGDVSLCDRLVEFTEMIVGNILTQSIQEIWASEQLRRLVSPPREFFSGTLCYECADYMSCTLHRVRCYRDARLCNGRFFSPDFFCERLSAPPLRFF